MINNKKEYIMCAAIWFPEIEYEYADIFGFGPYNIHKGLVLSGYRHMHILQQIFTLTGKKHRNIQGFLTSYHRFIDRTEACKIGLESGQLYLDENNIICGERDNGTAVNIRMIFSEDLWSPDFDAKNIYESTK